MVQETSSKPPRFAGEQTLARLLLKAVGQANLSAKGRSLPAGGHGAFDGKSQIKLTIS